MIENEDLEKVGKRKNNNNINNKERRELERSRKHWVELHPVD